VPCDPGSVVVNSGDMLQECSGHHYPSTTHRVVNPGGSVENTSRYSMPFFVHPHPETVLSEHYTARSYLQQRLQEIRLK
jgi:isopenicillin N synthase-like dioxygenase